MVKLFKHVVEALWCPRGAPSTHPTTEDLRSIGALLYSNNGFMADYAKRPFSDVLPDTLSLEEALGHAQLCVRRVARPEMSVALRAMGGASPEVQDVEALFAQHLNANDNHADYQQTRAWVCWLLGSSDALDGLINAVWWTYFAFARISQPSGTSTVTYSVMVPKEMLRAIFYRGRGQERLTASVFYFSQKADRAVCQCPPPLDDGCATWEAEYELLITQRVS